MLNRNLDTHQNTLQHVTKCYCPEAGKLIKREIYNTKEWKIAFYIQITSFIWKYPKVLFTSCAIWITPLYWNTGTYWLISQWLKYIFVLEHVTTTAKELPAPLGHFTVADKLISQRPYLLYDCLYEVHVRYYWQQVTIRLLPVKIFYL